MFITCKKEEEMRKYMMKKSEMQAKDTWCVKRYKVDCFSSSNSIVDFLIFIFIFVVDKCKKHILVNENEKSNMKLYSFIVTVLTM